MGKTKNPIFYSLISRGNGQLYGPYAQKSLSRTEVSPGLSGI